MNKIIIIGNLTREPEMRTMGEIPVCNFDVAVNEGHGDRQHTTYFRVSAWRKLGEACGQYLQKGRKVCVVGAVSCHAYQGRYGAAAAQMDVSAESVDFLSPARGDADDGGHASQVDQASGMVKAGDEDCPF